MFSSLSILNKVKTSFNQGALEFSKRRKHFWPEMRFLVKVKAGDRVLDVGCGNGRLFELVKNTDYYGIDNSKELIKIAETKYPQANFQTADALNLPFNHNFFDSTYAIAVLHHIPSKKLRQQFLKEIKRVLKPGGHLVLTVWNLKHWLRKDKIISFSGIKDCYVHCFSKTELKKAVKRAGFKIKEAGFISRKKKNKANIYLIAENQAKN